MQNYSGLSGLGKWNGILILWVVLVGFVENKDVQLVSPAHHTICFLTTVMALSHLCNLDVSNHLTSLNTV